MNRRNFLRLGAGAGMALVAAPLLGSTTARAATPYGGPFYVQIHASGGWDPIYFCDPKADATLQRYTTAGIAIGTVDGFSFPDQPVDTLTELGLDAAQLGVLPYLMSNRAFFEKYRSRVRVINGIDTRTNNHDIGMQAAGSGLGGTAYPSFGALAASTLGGDKALAYVSSGGYDATQGLVATTRLSAGGYVKVAHPFESNAAAPGTAPYHLPTTIDRIRQAQRERVASLTQSQHLPRVDAALSAMSKARMEDGTLANLELPTLIDIPGNQLGDAESLQQQIQLSLAAFKGGLAVASSLALGGFDTHAQHHAGQRRQIAKLLAGIDALWTQAEALGIADQITLVVTADFGRGPTFNVDQGKDHWPVTSALLMGRGVPAGRIGYTDDGYKPVKLNRTTLEPDPAGVRITYGHLHQTLRELAGITDGPNSGRYPISGAALPLLRV